jgi:hypothetical protein
MFGFEATVDGPSTARTTLRYGYAGDVSPDAHNRVAKVASQVTIHGTKDGTAFTTTENLTVELSGYGLPVKVDTPTNVVVAK